MIAAGIKSWRQSLGLSQAAAARELGVSTGMYQYYGAGEKEIPRAIDLACEALTGKLSMRRCGGVKE